MNIAIFYFFYNISHHSALLDKVIIFIADIFPYIVIMSAGLFLLLYYRIVSENFLLNIKTYWKKVFLVFLAGGIAWGIAEIIKLLVHSQRPFIALFNVQSLFPETGYAFPSQHATFFATIAMMIFFINKKVGYWFLFFALIIGITRIMAGVHFPIDIIGGFALGILVALIFNLIFKSKK